MNIIIGIIAGIIFIGGVIGAIIFVAFSAADWREERYRQEREARHMRYAEDVAAGRAYYPHYFADTWNPGHGWQSTNTGAEDEH